MEHMTTAAQLHAATSRDQARQLLAGLTAGQLADLANELRRPGGLITPFTAGSIPCRRTRPALTEYVVGLVGRRLDGDAIERAVWSA